MRPHSVVEASRRFPLHPSHQPKRWPISWTRHLHGIAAEQEVTDPGAACTYQRLQGVTHLPAIEVVGDAQVTPATMRERAPKEALWAQVIQIPRQPREVAVDGLAGRMGQIGACGGGRHVEGLARECHDRAQFFKGGVRAQTEQRPLAARGGLLADGIGRGAGAAKSHHAVPGLGDKTTQRCPGYPQAIDEIGS